MILCDFVLSIQYCNGWSFWRKTTWDRLAQSWFDLNAWRQQIPWSQHGHVLNSRLLHIPSIQQFSSIDIAMLYFLLLFLFFRCHWDEVYSRVSRSTAWPVATCRIPCRPKTMGTKRTRRGASLEVTSTPGNRTWFWIIDVINVPNSHWLMEKKGDSLAFEELGKWW